MGGLALAAVMANAGVIDQAQKQFQENSGISQANQKKLQQKIEQYGKMAQQEAKKFGIKFNFKQVMNNVQSKYEVPAKKAINKAANNAQAQINQAKNNPDVQKLQNQYQSATFNSVVTIIQNELKKQLQNVPNKQAKKHLISLLDQGAKEAKTALQKQQLLNKNIKKQVEAQKPFLQQEGGKLQQQIDAAIS